MQSRTDELAYPEFMPGDGGTPPYLAGREMEQQALLAPLARLRAEKIIGENIVVIGPRGNGKTVLMRWFEGQCKDSPDVDAIWLTPAGIGNNLDELANKCAPPKRWARLPDEIESDVRIAKLKWHLGNSSGSLTELLTARCRTRPLALLLDEAHTLDVDLGRTLLNASQEVRAKAPFLLVLGGTPGLQYRLSNMSASFWNRSEKLGIGLLHEAAARDALLVPFREHGIEVHEDVMATVIEESQRYPYFLQRWGKALTGALKGQEGKVGPLRQINRDILKQVLPVFEAVRVAYYEPMREEIKESGLQALAAAVSRKYKGLDALDEYLLDEIIAAHLQAADELPDRETEQSVLITAKRLALAGFGYVWRPPTAKAVWHAGIPSLMSHVLEVEEKTP